MPDPIEGNPAGDGAQSPVKTFTQEQLDQIVGDRLKREREKYADYEELKGKAGKYQELEDAQKTEAQKLADRLASIEKALGLKDQEISTLKGELTGAKRTNLVGNVAARLNALDPADANILTATASIDPAGANAEAEIEQAIKTLAEKKPYLFRQQGTTQTRGLESFNPAGGSGPAETDAQRAQRVQRQMQGAGRGFGPLG